jgi:hypothetical protein
MPAKIASQSPFIYLGVILALVGVYLSYTSYFIRDSIPLTAFGLSVIILAAVSFAFGMGQPKISDDVSSMFLESGLENTAALIEVLGLGSNAVYLPPSLAAGRPCAILPLPPEALRKIPLQVPDQLLVRHGQEPEDVGILISTFGSVMVGRHMQELADNDLEGALSSMLKGSTDLADGVKVVEVGGTIDVEITNPRIEYKEKIFENIGSPLASVVASVAAISLDKPITIFREDINGNKHMVKLKTVR